MAQKETEVSPLIKNEIKVEMYSLLAGEALSLSYERYKNPYFSFGANLNIRTAYKFTLGGEYDTKEQHHFLLFIRSYASKTRFYVEGFAGMATSRGKPVQKFINDEGFLVFRRAFKTYTDVVVGGMLGIKAIITKRILADINFGIGLGNLFNTGAHPSLIRGGMSLAYKF